jgi:hypothetical protein
VAVEAWAAGFSAKVLLQNWVPYTSQNVRARFLNYVPCFQKHKPCCLLKYGSVQLKTFVSHRVSCTVSIATSQRVSIRCWHLATLSPAFQVPFSTIDVPCHCTYNSFPYYSKSELCGGAVTVSFSKYLPWQAMHFLQGSTDFSITCCRPLITSKFLASELPFHVRKSPEEIAWGEIWNEFCVRLGKSGSLEAH